MDMIELTAKVKRGIDCHTCTDGKFSCGDCPYQKEAPYCSLKLIIDAGQVIDYWKGKYELTKESHDQLSDVLKQPMMILNIPHQKILSDPIDIRTTLREAEALRKIADAGNKASEALRDVTKAFHDLKEVFPDD